MRINFVVAGIGTGPLKSGGMICIFEYINWLTEKNHDVSVVTLQYNGRPDNVLKARIITPDGMSTINKNIKRVYKGLARRVFRDTYRKYEKEEIRKSYIKNRFQDLGNVIDIMPDCDVNIATSYLTSMAVYFSGKGTPYYFMQSFEEYFAADSPVPEFAKRDAALTYILPINKIANSTWLKNKILEYYPNERVMAVVNNAIDNNIFYCRKVEKSPSKIRVISYGGRSFPGKGFTDAAMAMSLVRKSYPDVEWLVFGDALLPPDNNIARYDAAGFLTGDKLAEMYSSGDIMLCTSWFESFPLFPLEGMACGLAVVTTPYGTEDYATDGVNCLFVPPKSPEEMAKAVIRLIEDKELRNRFSREGQKTAKQFTWERSVTDMERVLLSQAR